VGFNDEDDGPVERYTPSPERVAKARADTQRALKLVYVITAVTAIAGLVAAVAIGLTT
jgi:hypothetical protein